MAILGFFGKVIYKKANDAVSRAELKDVLDKLQEERREMHRENRETLSRIHDRVDALYENSYRGRHL